MPAHCQLSFSDTLIVFLLYFSLLYVPQVQSCKNVTHRTSIVRITWEFLCGNMKQNLTNQIKWVTEMTRIDHESEVGNQSRRKDPPYPPVEGGGSRMFRGLMLRNVWKKLCTRIRVHNAYCVWKCTVIFSWILNTAGTSMQYNGGILSRPKTSR